MDYIWPKHVENTSNVNLSAMPRLWHLIAKFKYISIAKQDVSVDDKRV
jgi:hypothetical protein